MPVDLAILKFINYIIANPALDFFFRYIGNFRFLAVPLTIAAILLLWKGGIKARWLVLLSVVIAIIVDSSVYYLLKPLFHRPRPCHAEPAITWLRTIAGCGGKLGFPSSHAANSFSQAVVVGAFYKRARIYLYIYVTLVSISRVYLGVHYPLDILGGAIYGIIISVLVLYLTKILARERVAPFFDSRPKINSTVPL